MKTVRIIPRLDIKGPNLVKGIHLEGLRVLGRPADFAQYYYEQGADELMFMDVVASLYERNSLHSFISETVKNVFIPITVGGGLRSIDDIKKVLRAGADKVCINTAAIKNPQFIKEASSEFGSSTIVVAIEAIQQPDESYLAFIDNGREYTGVEAIEWAQRVEELGAGELIVTSVDREGTGKGFDTILLNGISSKVTIPVVAHGGAGNAQQVIDVLENGSADAVCLASILHYEALKHMSNDYSNHTEGNLDFLKSGKSFKTFLPIQLAGLKETLRRNNFDCR
ncbi:glycosyl amidation-associated protein WbuZ [soil metagenome]|jgi:cyclase